MSISRTLIPGNDSAVSERLKFKLEKALILCDLLSSRSHKYSNKTILFLPFLSKSHPVGEETMKYILESAQDFKQSRKHLISRDLKNLVCRESDEDPGS